MARGSWLRSKKVKAACGGHKWKRHHRSFINCASAAQKGRRRSGGHRRTAKSEWISPRERSLREYERKLREAEAARNRPPPMPPSIWGKARLGRLRRRRR